MSPYTDIHLLHLDDRLWPQAYCPLPIRKSHSRFLAEWPLPSLKWTKGLNDFENTVGGVAESISQIGLDIGDHIPDARLAYLN